jgi:peptidoglycan hydrolase-like protein with peptidoglycan-binding domain
MAWRLAGALATLRAQVNAKWPSRGKRDDGTIGDEAHASRSSDHNPWVKDGSMGIVTGMDITHDPVGGFDSYAFADMLLKNQDKRLKYVISNSRIGSGPAGVSPGKWRKYTGANKHDHHCHISVMPDKPQYDDTGSWNIAGVNAPNPDVVAAYVAPPPTLRKGAKGEIVEKLQGRLNAHGAELRIDGDFGDITGNAVMLFQTMNDLPRDGIVGPMTWKALS